MLVRRTFEPVPNSVGETRRFVAAALLEADLAQLTDLALLAVSELASNAVEHARTSFEVCVTTDGPLEIAVIDGSSSMPIRTDVDPLDVSGRGLMLLEATGHRWGAEAEGTGKRVFWQYDLDQHRPPGSEPSG